jgi:hypothetical protein
MRKNLEPLRYSTLAPSRYLVYLHPDEYARLEGIVPILQEQTIRALAEELETLNRPSAVQRYGSELPQSARMPEGGPERRRRLASRVSLRP